MCVCIYIYIYIYLHPASALLFTSAAYLVAMPRLDRCLGSLGEMGEGERQGEGDLSEAEEVRCTLRPGGYYYHYYCYHYCYYHYYYYYHYSYK